MSWTFIGGCQVCGCALFKNELGRVTDNWNGYHCIAPYPSGIGLEEWRPNLHRPSPEGPKLHIDGKSEICVGFYDPVEDSWQFTDPFDSIELAEEARDAYRKMAIVHDAVYVISKYTSFKIIYS
jgi:hypothetical protein